MKYCINYNRDSKFLNECDELTINLTEKNQITESFEGFIQQRANQRIILKIDFETFEDDFDYFCDNLNNIAMTNSNFAIELVNTSYSKIAEIARDGKDELYKEKIHFPYFFDAFICYLAEFIYLRNHFNVSDLFIGGRMGFELKNLKGLNLLNHITIRACPNKLETTGLPNGTDPIYGFFIRPQDVDKYEYYIDVLDFRYCYNSKGKIVTDTFFRIYKEKKVWNGALNEIYNEIDKEIYNPWIRGLFVERRINCARQCLSSGKCDYCERLLKKVGNLNKMTNMIMESAMLHQKAKKLKEEGKT